MPSVLRGAGGDSGASRPPFERRHGDHSQRREVASGDFAGVGRDRWPAERASKGHTPARNRPPAVAAFPETPSRMVPARAWMLASFVLLAVGTGAGVLAWP